ncbi:MAG: hypothetical protein HOQ24_04030, partial [Mycobacteriaceae bacterium]|nr:hypothetical protein [Mycobacteriaceae bacterium]
MVGTADSWLMPIVEAILGPAPRGEPDDLRRVSKSWMDSAERWQEFAKRCEKLAQVSVAAGARGAVARAMADQAHGQAACQREVGAYCQSLGLVCRETAAGIELALLTWRAIGVVTAAQLTADVYLSFAGGTGLVAATAHRTAARSAWRVAWHKIVQLIATFGVRENAKRATMVLASTAIGGGLGAAAPLGIQLWQLHKGHRDGIDWEPVVVSGISGAIGALAGAGTALGLSRPVSKLVAPARLGDTRVGRFMATASGAVLLGTASGATGGVLGALAAAAATTVYRDGPAALLNGRMTAAPEELRTGFLTGLLGGALGSTPHAFQPRHTTAMAGLRPLALPALISGAPPTRPTPGRDITTELGEREHAGQFDRDATFAEIIRRQGFSGLAKTIDAAAFEETSAVVGREGMLVAGHAGAESGIVPGTVLSTTDRDAVRAGPRSATSMLRVTFHPDARVITSDQLLGRQNRDFESLAAALHRLGEQPNNANTAKLRAQLHARAAIVADPLLYAAAKGFDAYLDSPPTPSGPEAKIVVINPSAMLVHEVPIAPDRLDNTNLDAAAQPGSALGGLADAEFASDVADSRQQGPGGFAPIDPKDQRTLEDCLRLPDGTYAIGANPMTHPYGQLVNAGGIEQPGRARNCVDCALSGLSTYQGVPRVAAPRYFELGPDGTPLFEQGGEVGGVDRVNAWLGHRGRWVHPFSLADQYLGPEARQLLVSYRYDRIHDAVARSGPGAAAILDVSFAKYRDGSLVYTDDGRIQWSGLRHFFVVVYPHDSKGPIWWDPQNGRTWDHPPPPYVKQTGEISYVLVPRRLPEGEFHGLASPHHPRPSDPARPTSAGRLGTGAPDPIPARLGGRDDDSVTDTRRSDRAAEPHHRPDRSGDRTPQHPAVDGHGAVQRGEGPGPDPGPADPRAAELTTPSAFSERLREAMASGTASVELLQVSNDPNAAYQVDKIIYNDDFVVVRKKVRDPQHADAEILTWFVAGAIGARVPAIHLAEPTLVYVEYIPGLSGADLVRNLVDVDARKGDEIHLKKVLLAALHDMRDGRLIGFLDYLARHVDRHEGNVMIDAIKALSGIDNSGTHSAGGSSSTFAEHLWNRITMFGLEWIDPAAPIDMAQIRRNLDGLRAEFDSRGRGAWHEDMIARLDNIENEAIDVGRSRLGWEAERSAALESVRQLLTGAPDIEFGWDALVQHPELIARLPGPADRRNALSAAIEAYRDVDARIRNAETDAAIWMRQLALDQMPGFRRALRELNLDPFVVP